MPEEAHSPEKSKAASLGVVKLVALGVSLAVAGSFGPWGYGIGLAGWAGMLIAFLTVGAFYLCLLWCLAELSGKISEPGGGQAFAAAAFGPFGRYLVGGAASLEFLCSSAALAALIAIYVQALLGVSPFVTIPLLFASVVAIYSRGVGEAIGLTFLLSAITAIGVLIFVGIQGAATRPTFLTGLSNPVDLKLIWLALPFAVPFFIGIEGVPLAAADAASPTRDIPRAMFIALAIVASLGLAVLIAGPAGATVSTLSGTADTMLAALTAPTVAAPKTVLVIVNIAGLAGQCASFFGMIYACSRQVQAMALVGDLPRILGRSNRHGAPIYALVGPACIAALLAVSATLDQLIVILVAAAFIFYLVMIAAYVNLRRKWKVERRSFKGNLVVFVGTVLGAFILSSCVASNLTVLIAVSLVLFVLALVRTHRLTVACRATDLI